NSVFNNTCFMDNAAKSGGALGITGTISSLAFENTKFIHNAALIEDGGAINIGPYAHSNLANTTFKMVSFINNTAKRDGGALFVTRDAKSNTFEDVEFINNAAKGRNGGAIRFGANTYQFVTQGNSFKMVTFANNTANNNGGALYVTGEFLSNILELMVFENNTAKTKDGGAINFYKTVKDTTFNEVIFYKNSAPQSRSGAVNCDNGMENSIFNNTIFKENSALLTSVITLSHTTSSNTFKNTQFINNTANSYLMYVNNATSDNIIQDSIFLNNNASKITVKNGNIQLTDNWFGNNATCFDENPNINQTLDNWLFLNATVSPVAITLDQNSTIAFKFYSYDNKTKAVREYDGSASVPLGLYSTLGLLNRSVALINENIVYTPSKDGNGTVTGKYETAYYTVVIENSKVPTEIAAADVSTVYNVDKYLTVTLKDENGNPISGVNVAVDLNGAKTYTTDDNGQVKVSTKGLAPKAYVAKITFGGDAKYANSSKDVKVTVKKATPKIVAKSKTFKTTTKTKKYAITLKDNTGKAIKKAKVTLKVKGKTYKATTNSKGKATFKIKKLNKVGTFKAVVKYNGNKYYNKVSKKVKIKVIFKTVSKGSKDKSTVRKIQQALKDHGYYLSYKGRYLMVDGKFSSCTERSVKQFQRDNGLKVTGKVDQKTAKKLGII
ncbi:peptidoglycan-binding protein, partial [Methanobrevibacter sp.]|uniref:peptidoglycan-binding protein n=1 Tax=Methanobrevibacter sp. TaxID=66852 RepID=UPI002E788C54